MYEILPPDFFVAVSSGMFVTAWDVRDLLLQQWLCCSVLAEVVEMVFYSVAPFHGSLGHIWYFSTAFWYLWRKALLEYSDMFVVYSSFASLGETFIIVRPELVSGIPGLERDDLQGPFQTKPFYDSASIFFSPLLLFISEMSDLSCFGEYGLFLKASAVVIKMGKRVYGHTLTLGL